jgi:hypothetical protein
MSLVAVTVGCARVCAVAAWLCGCGSRLLHHPVLEEAVQAQSDYVARAEAELRVQLVAAAQEQSRLAIAAPAPTLALTDDAQCRVGVTDGGGSSTSASSVSSVDSVGTVSSGRVGMIESGVGSCRTSVSSNTSVAGRVGGDTRASVGAAPSCVMGGIVTPCGVVSTGTVVSGVHILRRSEGDPDRVPHTVAPLVSSTSAGAVCDSVTVCDDGEYVEVSTSRVTTDVAASTSSAVSHSSHRSRGSLSSLQDVIQGTGYVGDGECALVRPQSDSAHTSFSALS